MKGQFCGLRRQLLSVGELICIEQVKETIEQFDFNNSWSSFVLEWTFLIQWLRWIFWKEKEVNGSHFNGTFQRLIEQMIRVMAEATLIWEQTPKIGSIKIEGPASDRTLLERDRVRERCKSTLPCGLWYLEELEWQKPRLVSGVNYCMLTGRLIVSDLVTQFWESHNLGQKGL